VRYGDRCATVVVNDRGPYVDGRILDLSEGAAMYLGLPGVGDVRCEILRPA
jgi:rare lipoprotein A